MESSKLYHCCNTCAYQDNSSKATQCYNGFSLYYPNSEIKKQDEEKISFTIRNLED